MEGTEKLLEDIQNQAENLKGWKQKCDCGAERELDPSKESYPNPYFVCEECKKKNLIEKIKQKINSIIPKKYHNIVTDKEDLLKKCENKSVFCYGFTGTGKTVFATSLARAYIKIGKDVKYYSFPEFIMRLRNAYRKEISDIKTPWDIADETAKFSGVLILDDLGAEKTTDFVKEIIYFILNEREQRELITVITSNFSLDELDNTIDPRVSSRIAGMCEVLKFSGKDRRVNKK